MSFAFLLKKWDSWEVLWHFITDRYNSWIIQVVKAAEVEKSHVEKLFLRELNSSRALLFMRVAGRVRLFWRDCCITFLSFVVLSFCKKRGKDVLGDQKVNKSYLKSEGTWSFFLMFTKFVYLTMATQLQNPNK